MENDFIKDPENTAPAPAPIPNPGQPKSKLKIILITLGYLILFGGITTYFVPYFIGYLFGSALGEGGRFIEIAGAILLGWILLVFIGSRIFIKFIKKYSHSKTIFIIPVIFVLVLPYAYYKVRTSIYNYQENKAIEKIDTEARDCNDKFKNSITLKNIQESHDAGNKIIKINTSTTISMAMYITPSGPEINDAKNNRLFITGWYENDWKKEFERKFFEKGEYDLTLGIKFDAQRGGQDNWRWDEERSFTVKGFEFSVDNPDLCKYGGRVTASGSYITNKYNKADFMTKEEIIGNLWARSIDYDEIKITNLNFTPSRVSLTGGTKIKITGDNIENFNNGWILFTGIENEKYKHGYSLRFQGNKANVTKNEIEIISPPREASYIKAFEINLLSNDNKKTVIGPIYYQ